MAWIVLTERCRETLVEIGVLVLDRPNNCDMWNVLMMQVRGYRLLWYRRVMAYSGQRSADVLLMGR